MSKISKIANKGIQYDIGGSGDDDIRLVNLDNGFLLLKKVCPVVVIAFLNISATKTTGIRASGDFAGFEGSTEMMLSHYRSTIKAIPTILTVNKTGLSISLDSAPEYAYSGASCAGIYRVTTTK